MTRHDDPLDQPPPAARTRPVLVLVLVAKAGLVLGICAAGLSTASHGVGGVTWPDVVDVLADVSPWRLGLLTTVWLAGLGVYSFVLAAAMPGLGVRRGLLLNLTGSAVANLVPLGGAVATGLNWRMTRLWGHSDEAFVAFCLLTNALDVVSKLLFPVVAVGVLVAVSAPVPGSVWTVVAVCGLVLGLLPVLERSAVRHSGSGPVTGTGWWHRSLRRVADSGARTEHLLVRGWRQLIPASAGYLAAQVLLLVLSLHAVGLHPGFSTLLMAAAIERLGTVVAITPGGTGVAEIGTIAWLVATGLDPAEVVAGVLLYRAILVVPEIPLGGALLAAWVWLRRPGGLHGTTAVGT
jgi:uncharacterized membrane protein YbhN (UPF0104 family)